eukprot:gene2242-3461_t
MLWRNPLETAGVLGGGVTLFVLVEGAGFSLCGLASYAALLALVLGLVHRLHVANSARPTAVRTVDWAEVAAELQNRGVPLANAAARRAYAVAAWRDGERTMAVLAFSFLLSAVGHALSFNQIALCLWLSAFALPFLWETAAHRHDETTPPSIPQPTRDAPSPHTAQDFCQPTIPQEESELSACSALREAASPAVGCRSQKTVLAAANTAGEKGVAPLTAEAGQSRDAACPAFGCQSQKVVLSAANTAGEKGVAPLTAEVGQSRDAACPAFGGLSQKVALSAAQTGGEKDAAPLTAEAGPSRGDSVPRTVSCNRADEASLSPSPVVPATAAYQNRTFGDSCCPLTRLPYVTGTFECSPYTPLSAEDGALFADCARVAVLPQTLYWSVRFVVVTFTDLKLYSVSEGKLLTAIPLNDVAEIVRPTSEAPSATLVQVTLRGGDSFVVELLGARSADLAGVLDLVFGERVDRRRPSTSLRKRPTRSQPSINTQLAIARAKLGGVGVSRSTTPVAQP